MPSIAFAGWGQTTQTVGREPDGEAGKPEVLTRIILSPEDEFWFRVPKEKEHG
jgi:hypothetical protein